MIKRIIDKQTKLFIRDDFEFNLETEIGLEVEPAQGLYAPRWNGEAWEESLTVAEIEAIKANVEPIEPTETDRIEALEDMMLDMLMGGMF